MTMRIGRKGPWASTPEQRAQLDAAFREKSPSLAHLAPAAPPAPVQQELPAAHARAEAVTFTLPMVAISASNAREHHHARARRASEQRATAAMMARAHIRTPAFPLVVVITRVAPRPLDDDNLAGALKSIRDGIADGLGLAHDRDTRITWHVGQRKGPASVAVTIRPRADVDEAFDRARAAVLGAAA